jgi:hypothetical protein
MTKLGVGSGVVLSLVVALGGATALGAPAADERAPGAGNAAAAEVASASPLVSSARKLLSGRIGKINDRRLAATMRDLVENPSACVRHRANQTVASKQAAVAALNAAGLYLLADAAGFPGGVFAGVFPPVVGAGSDCPHLPQPFHAAPGSGFGGHHSYPGGLVLHESVNEFIYAGMASSYRRVYGHTGAGGLPVVAPEERDADEKADVAIDEDIVVAAPLLHDWAKTLVFQWNADGTELTEFNFGGNGATDNYGAPGDSRTGAHHIIGIAESMARGLAPKLVITQACAHGSPIGGEYRVVNWLRAAAILAGVDPVAKGYLHLDRAGRLRLPALNKLADFDLNASGPTEVSAPVEYQLHNFSDGDFVQSMPAMVLVQKMLSKLAPEFGYDPADAARYNTKYRNRALAYLSAERLYLLYSSGGLEAVRGQLAKLRAQKII